MRSNLLMFKWLTGVPNFLISTNVRQINVDCIKSSSAIVQQYLFYLWEVGRNSENSWLHGSWKETETQDGWWVRTRYETARFQFKCLNFKVLSDFNFAFLISVPWEFLYQFLGSFFLKIQAWREGRQPPVHSLRSLNISVGPHEPEGIWFEQAFLYLWMTFKAGINIVSSSCFHEGLLKEFSERGPAQKGGGIATNIWGNSSQRHKEE